MKAYCVKCKKMKDIKGINKKILGNKLHVTGLCSVCKTKMSTFAKK